MDKARISKRAPDGEKEEYRKSLRNLPFPEKVKIVVQLQTIAAPLMRVRGIDVHPWKI